ncbi:MAG: flagellar basal body P-ring formation chaperone FlgA [Beijerinckiaceae bacterium]|nr:flagellar basal body P-ring formation chaperone FlgA [Beijerinckiaceae bacterium]MCZ8301846.1 flagellar basal body P-ring formation chaperone FlgA [Beijerinckiaceae bacterium]
MRIATLLSGAGLAFALLSGTALAETLRLRAESVVDGEQVRLGHLVEGIDPSADVPVFRAPAPGTRGTIRADRVIAAARDMGITGIDAGSLVTVTIHRPGRVISRLDLQGIVAKALAERGAKGDLEVTLDDHLVARTVDSARREEIRVTRLVRDPTSGRFEARVILAGDPTSEGWMLTGSVVETREIAVPAQDLERGDAIEARKLVLVRRPVNLIGNDVLTADADLTGMIPRRTLKAGEPIRNSDLAKPILVEKNQIVTVLYNSGGLNLSMRGRSQNSGSMGEAIRVQNPQSKRIVEGVVTGQAQITISAPPAPTPNLAEAAPAARR